LLAPIAAKPIRQYSGLATIRGAAVSIALGAERQSISGPVPTITRIGPAGLDVPLASMFMISSHVHMRWFDDEKEPAEFLRALHEVPRLATHEGWRYQHVQAIVVAIDQYAEAATSNRDFFLNKPPRLGSNAKHGDIR